MMEEETPKSTHSPKSDLSNMMDAIDGIVDDSMPAYNARKKRRQIAGNTGKGIIRAIAFASIAIMIAYAVTFLSVMSGFLSISTIEGSSMEPEISRSDLVVSKFADDDDITEGDIISFENPHVADDQIVHRVVSVQEKDGATLITTKGDANAEIDPWGEFETPVAMYKHVLTIPSVGLMVQSVWGYVLAGVLAIFAVSVGLLFRGRND